MPTWPPDLLTISLGANILFGLALVLIFFHQSNAIATLKADTSKLFSHAATPAPPVVHVAAPVIDQAQIDAAVARALAARQVPTAQSLGGPTAQISACR